MKPVKIGQLLDGRVWEHCGVVYFTNMPSIETENENQAEAISIAINQNDMMVDRIEYLESALEKFIAGELPDTSVKKVVFRSWSCLVVTVGHGDIKDNFFTATTSDGLLVEMRKSLEIAGGGHGEGGRYVEERWHGTISGSNEPFDYVGVELNIVSIGRKRKTKSEQLKDDENFANSMVSHFNDLRDRFPNSKTMEENLEKWKKTLSELKGY